MSVLESRTLFCIEETIVNEIRKNRQNRGSMQLTPIYDRDSEQIVELLELGVSIRHISLHHLKYGSPSSVHYYVTTRKLRPD